MNFSRTTLNLNSEIGMGSARALRDDSGFTMIEIALCLAVIGVALVAIIGVLPIGMREQQDNRERTIINQDATVLLEAIRNGARGADDLANYVYAITNIQTFYNPSPQNPVFIGYGGGYLTNGARIVGLLSTPEYTDKNGQALPNLSGVGYSNHIVACIRSLSGSAVEKPPQNNALLMQDSFTYRVVCENLPVPVAVNSAYATNLQANLHELRLTFYWPQLPSGQLPPQPSDQPFRTMIAGQLAFAPDTNATPNVNLYFFQPQSFNAP